MFRVILICFSMSYSQSKTDNVVGNCQDCFDLSVGCEQRSLCDGRLHSFWNSVALLPTTRIHSQSGPGPEAVVTPRKQATARTVLIFRLLHDDDSDQPRRVCLRD